MRCRFRFPHAAIPSTVIRRRGRDKEKRFYHLKRTADEVNINAYNPAILRVWGANMDIQVVSLRSV